MGLQRRQDSKISRNRDELEFLPASLEIQETPPRAAGRLIILLICLFFTATITWAVYGSINTVAVATGRLVPGERIKVIQSLETATIRAIHVKDGQSVKQGELLIELDPTETQANIQSLGYDLMKARLDAHSTKMLLSKVYETKLEVVIDKILTHRRKLEKLQRVSERTKEYKVTSKISRTNIEDNREEISTQLKSLQGERKKIEKAFNAFTDLNAQENFKPSNSRQHILAKTIRTMMLGELDKHHAELDSISSQINEEKASLTSIRVQAKRLRDTIPLFKQRLQMHEGLFFERLTEKINLLNSRQNVIEKKAELASTIAAEQQVQAKIQTLLRKREEVEADFKAKFLERRVSALRQIANLEQQLRKEEKRNLNRRLRAPVDGTIIGLSIHTIGAVVNSADTLVRIVPAGSPLEIEAFILNKDIGFVTEGQKVEVKLEAFPFTKYGLIDGRVKRLDRDAIQDERRGLIYKTVISIETEKILVGNKWVKLAPGMSVQAEIKTGERKIIEFFLSPFLRYRDEALRER